VLGSASGAFLRQSSESSAGRIAYHKLPPIEEVPAAGVGAYLLNNGSLEKAQMMAAHESPRTTKLYDRTNDRLSLLSEKSNW
jgi:hypothetical protein